MPLCLSPHPLSEFVVCVEGHGHPGEHSAGREICFAIWSDRDTRWRYRTHNATADEVATGVARADVSPSASAR